MNIYCGNNAEHPDLLNGTKILGSRFSCLQKGKTKGYSQPVDPNFLLPYRPIDTTRKYCGNSSILPNGYNRFGGLYECYLKGVGVGKKLKANNAIIGDPPDPSPVLSSYRSDDVSDVKYNDPSPFVSSYRSDDVSDVKYDDIDIKYSNDSNDSPEVKNSYITGLIIYSLGVALFFIGMYYGKPSIIMDKTNPNEEKIDWSKFVPYLLSFCVIYAALVYFFIKYLNK